MKKIVFAVLIAAFASQAHAGAFFPNSGIDKNGFCVTLATTATTKFCPVSGVEAAVTSFAAATEITGRMITITGMYAQVTAPGTGNSHAFTLFVNGSSTAATCTISGAATTCSILGVAVPIAAGQTWAIQDVTTGTPAASNGQHAVIGTFAP